MLDMALIVALGLLVRVANGFLASLMTAIRRKRGRKEYKTDAWRTNSMMHQYSFPLLSKNAPVVWRKRDGAVVTAREELLCRTRS